MIPGKENPGIMNNTDNYISRMLVGLLAEHGVKDAIVSPGSRNTPLLVALSRSADITMRVVVDERSAAFIALGMSLVSGRPVAIVCTSGTALLNYAPAVAEAYYRRVPLIVISADRPEEWIDQDDSQTIVQRGALANYVKRSYDIPVEKVASDRWYANRMVNDAMLSAMSGRKAPVHINIQFDAPLGRMADTVDAPPRFISMIDPAATLTTAQARQLGSTIASPRKVMIVAGFMSPDTVLNRALGRLAALPNFVVLTETTANLHGNAFIDSIDSTLSAIDKERLRDFKPDVAITLGGALVSRHIKQFLRTKPPVEHWHVGVARTTIDCFQCLTTRIELEPRVFFPMLASAMQPHRAECDYASRWAVMRSRAISLRQSFTARIPWCDFKAFSVLIPLIPRRWNVHYSNGTPIRYAQIFGEHEYHRCDCNRGVSGIDGCTSTAIGASLAYNGDVTLLVTGDMSALYDIGALACNYISPHFKMVVIDNGGGGIFRFIGSTDKLDILDDCFSVSNLRLPLRQLAEGFGFSYFEAADETELRRSFAAFRDETDRPAMLRIVTDGAVSADILKNFFEQSK